MQLVCMAFADRLGGTALLNAVLWSLGAEVGKDVMVWDNRAVSEPDLARLGKGAVVAPGPVRAF